jgi:precorrin-4 methylase
VVSQEILDLIPGEVKVARKLPGCAELAQEEIYWWAYQGLAQGKHVVRLKIGDPFVFGRGGEEVLKFRQYGVEPTVIPVSRLSRAEHFLSMFLAVGLSHQYRICFSSLGRVCCLFSPFARIDTSDPQRCSEPGGHVHRVRA